MIIKAAQNDVFKTKAKHIAFAINTEGYNDCGFAGMISCRFWDELAHCGPSELGTVKSKTIGDVTLHALVCHSLYNGWGDDQAAIIKECFDKIPANGETIASIAIGNGFVGQNSGADLKQIFSGMHDSEQNIILHSEYTLDDVMELIDEAKNTRGRK